MSIAGNQWAPRSWPSPTSIERSCRPLRTKHGIAHRRTDYHAILEARGAEAVDIVDICTPPWLHASMAIDALRAGKHVLCEKPFALSSEDKPSIVTAEHARHVIEIIEAAYRAAETGQTQELTTVGRRQQ
jgi:predicted dehydrogenase